MPAKFSVKSSRTTLDLPEDTRVQIAELMGDNEESLKDCIIICVQERWQRECGTPERDLVADVDAMKERLSALEQIAAEGYDSWFETKRDKIGL